MTEHPLQRAQDRPFKVLGIQQIAIGALDKLRLQTLWVDMLGLEITGTFRSEKENVDEDICSMGMGAFAVEVDLMQPLDPDKKPAVHSTPLNHVGLWIDDLPTAVQWLTKQGVRFAPGGIRKGAAGHDICFVHPKSSEEFPVSGEGVLIELVQAPPGVIAALAPTTALAGLSRKYGALNLVSLPTWIFDIDNSRVLWANTAALSIWDARSVEELCARDMAVDMSDSVARRLRQYQSDFIAHSAVFNEQWTLYPGGRPVPVKARCSGIRLDDGRMAMWCEGHLASVEFDTPEHLRSVEALLHTEVMISLYAMDGSMLYRNPAARESVKRLTESLQERMGDAAVYARFMDTLQAAPANTITLLVSTAKGERWLEMSARRCRDAVTGLDAVLVSEADVTSIKRTEARANFLAMHDALTGLPNRIHVMERFAQTMAQIAQTGQQAALMYIDLDHFKDVNDTLGHSAGDELLVHMAQRMRDAVRSSDLVARLGGDEFLILIVSRDIRSEVDRVRERLLLTIAQPVSLRGTDVRMTPSLGVSLYPKDGADIDTLLRNADLAMYSAKAGGRNELAFYEEAMTSNLLERTTLEAELRRALEHREFEVHYQPRVSMATGRISGAEALVRWRHPQRGLVAPDAFISVCEETGLIHGLGAWVFDTAVRQQVAWASAGFDLSMGVNLSPRQLRDPHLLETFRRSLASAGCEAGRVQVEITESVLVGHDARTLERMHSLQELGLSIALDDFGTGYSNLAYLHRLPITTLKIDKAFVQGIVSDLPLAELIVSMCRMMRLDIVAEGVETDAQRQWVQGQGIDSFQGYWFSRPLDAAAFTRLLEQQPAVDAQGH